MSLSLSNIRLAESRFSCPYGSRIRRISSKVSGRGVSRSRPIRLRRRSRGSTAASYPRPYDRPGDDMIRLRRGLVVRLGDAKPGAHEIEVLVDGDTENSRAIAFPELVGAVTAGDRVVLNTTALALRLGTGGRHIVIAVEGSIDSPIQDEPIPGRVTKVRYTPSQTVVSSVEETHAETLEASTGLHEMPVVCAPL